MLSGARVAVIQQGALTSVTLMTPLLEPTMHPPPTALKLYAPVPSPPLATAVPVAPYVTLSGTATPTGVVCDIPAQVTGNVTVEV
jgi:hypothetical protein